jgi:hypothetical protein
MFFIKNILGLVEGSVLRENAYCVYWTDNDSPFTAKKGVHE